MTGPGPYIPLYTDLTDKKVMVAGSGKAAQETIRYLHTFTQRLYYLTEDEEGLKDQIPSGVTVMKKAYERSDLYGMDYVISLSGDSAVNEDIYITCRTLGIRVHIRSNPKRCDFFLEDHQ